MLEIIHVPQDFSYGLLSWAVNEWTLGFEIKWGILLFGGFIVIQHSSIDQHCVHDSDCKLLFLASTTLKKYSHILGKFSKKFTSSFII